MNSGDSRVTEECLSSSFSRISRYQWKMFNKKMYCPLNITFK